MLPWTVYDIHPCTKMYVLFQYLRVYCKEPVLTDQGSVKDACFHCRRRSGHLPHPEEGLRTSDSLMRWLAQLHTPGRAGEPFTLPAACQAADVQSRQQIAAHLRRGTRHVSLSLSFSLTHPSPSNRFRYVEPFRIH